MFSVMNTAKNEGFVLGKEEGIEIGRVQEKLENARLLLSCGMAKEQVIAILTLTNEVAAQL